MLAHKTLAERAEDSATPIPRDVRLFFPCVGERGAEIWTTSALLSTTSPYLEDLLSSDFADSVSLSAKKRPRPSAVKEEEEANIAPAEKDFEDSDDETDEIYTTRRPRTLFDVDRTLDLTYRQITIRSAAFTTYLAVIRWLETGYIRFVPLRSTCKPLDPTAKRTRNEQVESLMGEPNETWVPVSPKSVYRLAHLLDLPQLESLALIYIKHNLTPECAAHELFDNASVLYDAWRQVVIDYVVGKWDEVSQTSSWTGTMDRIERDEVRGAGGILIKLFKAREEAAKTVLTAV
ncbi:hypothetical protein Rhopal_004245-T1 [Rhodotorula paludigena]|uniref:BTB domain-containing protein n=1 Tax=Rhodotorula paludigena TaxID=86838 RepID=A0AAV5GPC7_9BASI|nr:hypothetical protein Rhopal_004245-T1 [Rhodotorula paludigena]